MTDNLKVRMRIKSNDGGYYNEWWKEALDRIEALEAALQYYANDDVWIGKKIHKSPNLIAWAADAVADRGDIARAALAGEKKDV